MSKGRIAKLNQIKDVVREFGKGTFFFFAFVTTAAQFRVLGLAQMSSALTDTPTSVPASPS